MEEEKKEKNERKLTHRQIRAIEFWREDNFGSKAEALRKAGYGESVYRHPNRVFGSPAVQAYFMKAGIREGLIFQPLKIEGDAKYGGAYNVVLNENTEEGYELVKAKPGREAPRLPMRVSGEVDIPNTPLSEAAKYSKPTDPFEMGDVSDWHKDGQLFERMDKYSCM